MCEEELMPENYLDPEDVTADWENELDIETYKTWRQSIIEM